MAWVRLLVLLASGSWGLTVVPEELHQVVGQTLLVTCRYTPERGPYVPKTWCQQTSARKCTRVVTTSQPQTAAAGSRHIIWDDPDAGFFILIVPRLREEDPGSYWCGSFNSSRNVVLIVRNISLVLSPASSTSPIWTTTQLPVRTVLIPSPEGTSSPIINGSQHRKSNSSSSLGGASQGLQVSVHGGLLVLKGLVLSALCVLLCCRRRQGHKDIMETAMIEFSDYASPAQTLDYLDAFSQKPGYRRNI